MTFSFISKSVNKIQILRNLSSASLFLAMTAILHMNPTCRMEKQFIKTLETIHMKMFASNYPLPTPWGKPYKPLLFSLPKRSRDLSGWYPHMRPFQINGQVFEQHNANWFWGSLDKVSSVPVGVMHCTSSKISCLVNLVIRPHCRCCIWFCLEWIFTTGHVTARVAKRAMICKAYLTSWSVEGIIRCKYFYVDRF